MRSQALLQDVGICTRFYVLWGSNTSSGRRLIKLTFSAGCRELLELTAYWEGANLCSGEGVGRVQAAVEAWERR